MKNWPKPELNVLERLNIKITKKIYQFALRKERNGKVLERLYFEAKHNQNSIGISSLNVANYSSDLVLEEVAYYDIYPIEEMEKLEKGLSKIARKYRYPKGSFGFVMHRIDSAIDFLRDARKFKYRGGYCDAGSAYFGNNSTFKCIDSVNLSISTISSSYACLVLTAKPSEYFKDKFHQISKQNEEIDTKITFPNIKFGLSNIRNWHRHGHSSGNIFDFKHRNLDELFLQANKEIVKCLRKNIKAGLAMEGPLPQVEIISTNNNLDYVITDIYKNDVSDSQKQFDEYLKYVGYSSHKIKPYSNSITYLYKVNRSRHYNLSAYQILISFNSLSSEDNIQGASGRDETMRNLKYLYPYLCSSLSIQVYLKHIYNNLFSLHKRISKVLRKETSKGISLIGFKKNISKTAKINWLKFQQNRLWSEIKELNTFSYLKTRMIEFKREPYKWEMENSDTPKNFLDILEDSVTHMKDSNDNSIEFIEVANDQLLKLKNIVINTRLQYGILALTLLLFVLTLFLVPGFWDIISNLINYK